MAVLFGATPPSAFVRVVTYSWTLPSLALTSCSYYPHNDPPILQGRGGFEPTPAQPCAASVPHSLSVISECHEKSIPAAGTIIVRTGLQTMIHFSIYAQLDAKHMENASVSSNPPLLPSPGITHLT